MSERSILIVEDDAVAATGLAETLELLGYGVSGTVSTGEEALQSVERSTPQIVLMDIRLRGTLDGIEAARQIRSRFDVPVVYLSGFSDQALLDRAMQTEPYGYLVKPIEMKALITTIETTLCKHQVDKRLRESEERYRNLFDNAPVGIFQTTVDGRFLNVNPAQARMLGYESPQDFFASVKNIATDILAQPERFKTMVDTLLERDQIVNIKAEFRRRDGQTLTGNLHSQVARNDDGSIRWVEGFFEDISDRLRAEHEREKQKERFETLVDNAPFGMVMIRNDATYEYVNPKFIEMFGYDLRDVPDGREWFRKAFPVPEYRHKVISEWLNGKTVNQAGEKRPGTFTVTCADGTEKDIDFRPVQLRAGGYVVTCEDITERRRAERDRETMRAQLFQAQKMQAIGTLTGGIAHNFNNLLTIILGYAQLLLDVTEEDDPKCEDLSKIVQATRSGADLVKRLSTFGSPTEAKRLKFNLNDRIQPICRLLSKTIPKMVEIKLKLATDLALIMADPGQMDQTLMNLALNAGEAMPDGGRLTVETRNVVLAEEYCLTHHGAKPGKYAMLRVSDTGQGMQKETFERMFDPFFTTKGWDSRKGTGLGLATVQGIVQKHGGHIECFSELGHGTTFQIYLPITPADGEVEKEAKEPTQSGGPETILLVEDEEYIRELGSRYLKREGYIVVEAGNGKEALDLYREHQKDISLIILDLIMREMGGKQCIEELCDINPKVNIFIASGYSVNEHLDGPTKRMAKGFIGKPFDRKELLQAVRNILDVDEDSAPHNRELTGER
jgi:two-component system, cell cycle sensor histidine kinase and response regulator CckA